MIPEVEADAHDFARPRERRTEPFGLRDFRRGGAAAPYPVRQRAKAVAAEEALVVLLHQLRRVHPRAVVELHAGTLVAGRAESHELHATRTDRKSTRLNSSH